MNVTMPSQTQPQMSAMLAETLARASEAAAAFGSPFVTVEHVLLALSDDTDAVAVLDASRVSLGRLKSEVIGYLTSIATQPPPVPGAIPLASHTADILTAAAMAAQGGRRREVNGAIVLAAIVGDGRSVAARMLSDLGLTFEQALQALTAEPRLSAPPPAAEDVLARARERVQSRAQPTLREMQSDTYLPRPPVEPLPTPASMPMADPPWPVSAEPIFADVPEPALPEIFVEPAPVVDVIAPQPAEVAVEPSAQADVVKPSVAATLPKMNPEPEAASSEQVHRVEPTLDLPSAGDASSLGEPSVATEASNTTLSAPERDVQPPPDYAPTWSQAPTPRQGYVPPPPPMFELPPRPHGVQPPPIPPRGFPQPLARGASVEPQFAPSSPFPPIAVSSPAPMPMQSRPSHLAPPPGFEPAPLGSLRVPAPAPMPLPDALSTGSRQRRVDISEGVLSENIPRSMRVGACERIEVRIGNAALADVLVYGMDGAAPAVRHGISMTPAMSVRLRAPDGGFFIETASPETQWIEGRPVLSDDDFASWRFLVTPQTRGRSRLQIVVAARTVGPDGIAAETVLPDQTIDVRVRTNYRRSAGRWLGWGIAAVVGGVLSRFGDAGFSTLQALLGGPFAP